MRLALIALAGLVGTTEPAFAQAPGQPVVLIFGTFREAGAPLHVLHGEVWPNQPCDFRLVPDAGGNNARSEQILVHITPGELRDCKIRLSGEIQYVWLSDEGKTAEEKRRVVRQPLPPSVAPGKPTRVQVRTETGKVYEIELQLESAEIK
jgi:hypothetical protein